MKKRHATSDRPITDHTSTGAEPPDQHVLSRRGFFVRATQVGAALSVASPGIGHFLQTAGAQGSLAHGALGEAPAPQSYSHLYSGLRWRMLGP
ncbi:MAG: hypothetical protein ACRDG3_13565, partial [Tepidiformaceae bacterium]